MGRFTPLFKVVKRALTRVFKRNKSQGDTVIMDNVMLSVAHTHINPKLKGVSLVEIMLQAFLTSALQHASVWSAANCGLSTRFI